MRQVFATEGGVGATGVAGMCLGHRYRKEGLGRALSQRSVAGMNAGGEALVGGDP
jgi:hypothetical protein